MAAYIRKRLRIPADIQDASNRVAAVFDPDSGGVKTFGVCRLGPSKDGPVTHYLANTLIDPDYLPLLADPAIALAALNQLADLRERDRVTLEDVTAFCNGVEIDPPDDLERVEAVSP